MADCEKNIYFIKLSMSENHFNALLLLGRCSGVNIMGDIIVFQKFIHCFESGEISWFLYFFIECLYFSKTRATSRSNKKEKEC